MEAVQSEIGGWLLDTMAARSFRRVDFHETRDGVCRLMPPLAKLAAETAPQWAEAVASVVKGAAWVLLGWQVWAETVRTADPLMQANRSAGEAARRLLLVRPARAAGAAPAALRGARRARRNARTVTA